MFVEPMEPSPELGRDSMHDPAAVGFAIDLTKNASQDAHVTEGSAIGSLDDETFDALMSALNFLSRVLEDALALSRLEDAALKSRVRGEPRVDSTASVLERSWAA